MISEKQLEANRHNAQKSTGPRTDEGRRISSQNALRHALTAQVSVMTDEDRAAHDKFCSRIVESPAPDGANECDLAQLIAEDRWRLHRIHAVEDNIFALGFSGPAADIEVADSPAERPYPRSAGTEISANGRHPEIHAALTQARVFISNPKQSHLITLYAQRTNRDIEKNAKQLRDLQTERKARREREIAEAARLKQLNEMKNLPFDPAENGFVFSAAEIDRFLARERRLKEAKSAASVNWSREKYLQYGGSLAA